MGRTAYTEPHCLYKGGLYLYFSGFRQPKFDGIYIVGSVAHFVFMKSVDLFMSFRKIEKNDR